MTAFRPEVCRLGVAVELAAERGSTNTLRVDRPSDVLPELGTEITGEQAAEAVRSVSAAFAELGVTAGSRVVVVKRNHIDIQLLSAAAARLGALPFHFSGRMRPDQAPIVLGRAQPDLVVTDAATVEAGALSQLDRSGLAKVTSVDGGVPGAVDLGQVARDRVPPARPRPIDEPMLVTHTSGTTGPPKLVALSARSVHGSARLEARAPLTPRTDDRCAAMLSWVHARAVIGLMAGLWKGRSLLALSDYVDAVPILAAYRPTCLDALPNAYMYWEADVRADAAPVRDVRLFHSTFDAIHPRTVRTYLAASERWSPIWAQTWGQSEAGGVALGVYTRRTFRKPAATGDTRPIGRAMPGFTKVRAVDRTTGRPVRGRTGRLHASTSSISLTYIGQEDLHASRRRGPWWTMGDLGSVSRLGRVSLLDREIDATSGIASCLAVEDVLTDRLPELSEAVLVSVGEGPPTVVVATYDGLPVDARRWAEATADLPALVGPLHLPWHQIPRTETMKVRRYELADALADAPAGTAEERSASSSPEAAP